LTIYQFFEEGQKVKELFQMILTLLHQ